MAKKNKKKKNQEKLEAKCKNCLLYRPDPVVNGWGVCGVAVLNEGKQIHIPVEYESDCFFEEEYVFKSKHTQQQEVWKPDVKNVKWWEEDGKVKIEYPEGFFGKEDLPTNETNEEDL